MCETRSKLKPHIGINLHIGHKHGGKGRSLKTAAQCAKRKASHPAGCNKQTTRKRRIRVNDAGRGKWCSAKTKCKTWFALCEVTIVLSLCLLQVSVHGGTKHGEFNSNPVGELFDDSM